MPPVYVAILMYNDRVYLPQFLPSVLETAYDRLTVWVIDNGSDPALISELEAVFGEYLRIGRLRLVRYEANTGYAGGYQRFFESHGREVPYLALLNSDVEVTATWLEPLIRRLEEEADLAALQPKVRAYHRRDYFEYAGGAGGLLNPWGYPTCRGRRGFQTVCDTGQYDQPADIFWASGAAFVVRTRAVAEKLGGLLFKPYYFMHMEEIDLCWRLQRAGYRIGYEPSSLVYHVGGASLAQGHPQKAFYNFRNNLLLLAENLHPMDRWLIIWRLILDGIAGLYFLFRGQPRHTWAIVQAHGGFYRRLWEASKRHEPALPYKRLRHLGGRSSTTWLMS